MEERIELLSPRILDRHRPVVREVETIDDELDVGLGWHYLLDIPWVISQIDLNSETRVLAAGALRGVLQWYLAKRGVDVISVDRTSRKHIPLRFRNWCHVTGYEDQSMGSPLVANYREILDGKPGDATRPEKVARTGRHLLENLRSPKYDGTVEMYNADLLNLDEVPSNAVDAVVSVSALEHNEPDTLREIVSELERVVRPGGKIVATLVAAPESNWWHDPSSAMCYTDDSLRDVFGLDDDCPSNYDDYEELFAELEGCEELQEKLDEFYYQCGDNGMPWGEWNPEYLPVGVVSEVS